MRSILRLLTAVIAFDALLLVNAGLFVVDPKSGSTCNGGEACTVTWVDDGSHPLLSDIGTCTVGLYTGNQQLVQTIAPVDVSTTHSLTFTPIPAAGPNSSGYYISFISLSEKQNNSDQPYTAFSSFFTLDRMTGSFSSPDSSAISSIPVPSSGSGTASGTLSTTTVGSHSSAASHSGSATGSVSSAVHSSANPSSSSGVSAVNSASVVSPSTLTLPPSLSPTTAAATSSFTTLLSTASAAVPSTTAPSTASTGAAIGTGVTKSAGMSVAVVVFGLALVLA